MDRKTFPEEQPELSTQSQDQQLNAQNISTNSSTTETSQSRKVFWFELGGLVLLVIGLVGYQIYQEYFEQPSSKASEAKASPSAKPVEPLAKKVLKNSASNSDPTDTTASQEIYQRAPDTGIYYAGNPLLNSSRREIASSNGRFCIKITNSPPASMSGYQQIIVSSLSFNKDSVVVDATKEQLQFNYQAAEMKDSRGRWQLLESKTSPTGALESCLAANAVYAREIQGAFISGSDAAPSN